MDRCTASSIRQKQQQQQTKAKKTKTTTNKTCSSRTNTGVQKNWLQTLLALVILLAAGPNSILTVTITTTAAFRSGGSSIAAPCKLVRHSCAWVKSATTRVTRNTHSSHTFWTGTTKRTIATSPQVSIASTPSRTKARTFSTSIIMSLSSTVGDSSSGLAAGALNVRVVSYNVLSSHLASPDHFTTLNPDHLAASARLPVVLQKLEDEMTAAATSSTVPTPVVFCLQEVSYDWASALHTFFANRGYHFVTGLYGKKFNGYMGVGLAFSIHDFHVEKVDISRLSDQRYRLLPPKNTSSDASSSSSPAWPPWDPEPPVVLKLWTTVRSMVNQKLQQLGVTSPEPEIVDHWAVAANRFNVLLTAILKDKRTGHSFCIGNYHMPCAYYAPMVMTIHADMAIRQVQYMAGRQMNKNGNQKQSCTVLPYILAGDFNIKPTDAVYRLLTTATLDPSDPVYPTPKNGVSWTPLLVEPVQSAYAASSADGKTEPDFTNYARVREDEPFIDTLDYIFYNANAWKVTAVKELPHRDNAKGPFPNLDVGEPSDHILIAANLELQLPTPTTE